MLKARTCNKYNYIFSLKSFVCSIFNQKVLSFKKKKTLQFSKRANNTIAKMPKHHNKIVFGAKSSNNFSNLRYMQIKHFLYSQIDYVIMFFEFQHQLFGSCCKLFFFRHIYGCTTRNDKFSIQGKKHGSYGYIQHSSYKVLFQSISNDVVLIENIIKNYFKLVETTYLLVFKFIITAY